MKSLSAKVLLLLVLIILIIRFSIPFDNTIQWDVFGYYLYLPAKFVFHDLGVKNIDWLNDVFKIYHPSDAMYQVNPLPNGGYAMHYSIGTAVLSFPFFIITHYFVKLTGIAPADGFSFPYQVSYAMSALFYTLVGLYYFRKFLLFYFSENITSVLLIIVVLATNYLQLVTEKSTLTHNYLFTLYALLLFHTFKWHQEPTRIRSIIIGLIIGIITIIRPNECVIILVPLLWGVYNKSTFIARVKLIFNRRVDILLIGIAFLIGISPQILYWKIYVGKWLYYTYTSTGQGFDFTYPYIMDYLFSFRKGWFVYTPIMIFAFIGFISLYKKNKSLFYPLVLFLAINIYVISCWSCWWYAAGSYSARSVMPAYTMLSIPLGYLLQSLWQNKIRRIITIIFISAFTILNLFQFRQAYLCVLDGDRMTRAYYFRTFGKLSASDEDKKLLLIDRGIDKSRFIPGDNYIKSTLGAFTFEDSNDTTRYSSRIAHEGKHSFMMNSNNQFSPGIDITYNNLSSKEYLWIFASAWVFIPIENDDTINPVLVASFHHRGNPYEFCTSDENPPIEKGKWTQLHLKYLSPEIWNKRKDNLKVYIWYKGTKPIYVDDLVIDKYEPK